MPHPPIRVGVIGLGFMGATHVTAYQQAAAAGFPCKLTAVCDVNPDRRRGNLSAVAGQLDTGAGKLAFDPAIVNGYERAEDLIADPNVDLISVCTQTPLHVDMAERALRAGKHVIVEKPVAVDVPPIQRLAAVARETKRLCMPAMCIRFWPEWAWLKRATNDGTYGKLLGLSCQRMAGLPGWSQSFFLNGAQSGGALVDLHLHDADFLVWLLGMPAEVTSAGFPGPSGCIDRVSTTYRYVSPDAPKLVTAEAAWEAAGFPFRMRYVATFERATADYDISRKAGECLLFCREGKADPVQVDLLTGYDLEIRAAITAISTGDFASLPTLEESIAVTRMLDAERTSAQTAKPVALA